MKRLSKVVVVLVFMFSFTFSAIAKEEEAKFYASGTAYSQDEVEALKETQKSEAESYKKGLSACYDFNYATDVEENDDTFDTIAVETEREKDSVVREKEEEGYTVTAEEKSHDKQTEEYEFDTLNGRVRSATKNGNANYNYIFRNVDSVISSNEFTEYENGDTKVIVTIEDLREAISESAIRTSASQARNYSLSLRAQGYDASYVQNNNERTNFEITSRRRISSSQLQTTARTRAQQENPNKEILDLRLDNNQNPTVVTEEYTTSDEANQARERLEGTGLYTNVEVVTDVDQNESHLVETEHEIDWTSTDEEPYYEDVYTDNVVTGYRYFYLGEKVVEEEETVTVEHLTRDQCYEMYGSTQYTSWNKSCVREINNNPGNGPGRPRYTFTATKPAVTAPQGYYDEYQYAVKYTVNAYYYRYTGSYIATDYTVSYTGNRGIVRIVKDTYDKYYDVDGTKKVYTVTTSGEKEDNGTCITTTATTDEEKTVNTGVKENTYYKVVLLSSVLVLLVTVSFRKKLCK